MSHSRVPNRSIVFVLLLLVVWLSGCGLLGDDGGDDDKFPKPPERPGTTAVISAGPSAAPTTQPAGMNAGPSFSVNS